MAFLREDPGFDRNVAAHVINVRGTGQDFRSDAGDGDPPRPVRRGVSRPGLA